MNEVWKDVVGYEGLYKVSNTGKIKSLYRQVKRSDGKIYTNKERLLKYKADNSGYYRTALSGKGKLRTIKVHREVAKAFLPINENRKEVNHKDGIKTNNNVDNLEWVNRSENILHSYKNGLQKLKKGESSASAKITELKALTIKTLLHAGWGPAKISREYNISNNITKDISRNKTWRHIEL